MPEFPVNGPISATIRTAAGSVRIIAEERDSATVDVRPGNSSEAARQSAADTFVEMNGDTLVVETPQARGFLVRRTPSLDVAVRIPLDSRLMVRTASADVFCEGRVATADVNTASGDLQIDQVAGDLTRNAASGDTQFGVVGGSMSCNSASGDVRGRSVGGDLTSKSASGDTLVDAVGGSVRATTASGDIEVGNLARGSTSIHSASGDVQLGVAPGTAVWMDVSTISGDTRSDLNVSDSSPTGSSATLELNVRTVSGDVTIRRSTTAPAEPSASSTHIPATGASDDRATDDRTTNDRAKDSAGDSGVGDEVTD
jgi:hypothetical protein